MAAKLRDLLENDYDSKVFGCGGIADVTIPMAEVINQEIAAMRRGLFAHSALNVLLEKNGEDPRKNLDLAIMAASQAQLITRDEMNRLQDIRHAANFSATNFSNFSRVIVGTVPPPGSGGS